MLTLFTIPRAFEGNHEIRQENAIGSWTRLLPRPEIILFCDDPGVAEVAEKFDCVHVPDIKCGLRNVPYVNEAFLWVSENAKNDLVCYVNCDIVFFQNLIPAVQSVAEKFPDPFLMIGRRWNLAFGGAIDFTGNWQARVRATIERDGVLHSPSGVDYFVHRKGTIGPNMPQFLVGSPKWDNWTVADCESRGFHVVEATSAVTSIHQSHPQYWPKDGIDHNVHLWQRAGGKLGYTYTGRWFIDQDFEVRRKR